MSTEMLFLPGCFLANCLYIKATADSWLRNKERTIRCKWISCLSEVILEYFQMDGVIIIGTFGALLNPLLLCQIMKPRYHKWAYSAHGHCYHDHVKPCSGWSGQRGIIYWKDCSFLSFAVPPKVVKLWQLAHFRAATALRPSATSAKTKSISG